MAYSLDRRRLARRRVALAMSHSPDRRRLARCRVALAVAYALDRRRFAQCCVALAAAAALLPAASAHAAAPADPCAKPAVTNFLGADATKPGVVDLYFFHAEGAPVTYYECVSGHGARRLGTLTSAAAEPTVLRDATTWSCDRLVRRFVATAPRAGGAAPAIGTYSVRTMSCAQRFELRVPRRVGLGRMLGVRVVDRWGIGGIRAGLCVTPPGGSRRCSPLRFARAVTVAARRLRANTPGRVRVELRVRDRRVRSAAVAVGGGALAKLRVLPVVLATGDSMMQGIDGFLADELGDSVSVRSDVRPGTAIGKTLDWLAWSRRQAAAVKPRVTVMAIGANEGWPQTTPAGAVVACCDEPWVAEYARRVRAMMRTYLRGGHGKVVWATLPAPRGEGHAAIFAAVNRAVLRAAEGLEGVTIVRQDLIFTPTGFRDVMRYRGRDVRVREPDGIHLNVSGTAIAAAAIARLISGS